MKKIKAIILAVASILMFTGRLYCEEPVQCIGRDCIDIFSSSVVERFGLSFSSFCSEDTLFYPYNEEDQVVLEEVVCQEGCAIDRCNMQNDGNQNGQFERGEVLEALKAQLRGEIKELVLISIFNYWRKQ